MMIKVGIIGSTGYAGQELVRLLLQHKEAEIVWYGSRSYVDEKFSAVFGNMFQIVENVCKGDDLHEVSKQADVIFTATPQGYLASVLDEEILSNCKVIDLSADFRIKDVDVYEKWYGIEHKSKQFIGEAVYGLCELNREKIKGARLIANPGCYPTCSTLSIYPMVKNGYIDTDTPEIEEQLGYAAGKPVMINFTPHLIPMNRGILITAYAKLNPGVTKEMVRKAYEEAYKDEYFVRVLNDGVCPETRWVEGSNFVDVSPKVDERTGRVIMMGAMDNITKGAAGQAVQNMNLLFGLDEAEGLRLVPVFP